ncbi:Chs2p [Malassezia vespertilionis]|uniref:Chitin synthase n=1 Tax=Malassezia vespertilionis TaxID=2020962 RepID=A0A2N1JGE5_9BASI|nr:Chs2p [Malassezia vespertilionis]
MLNNARSGMQAHSPASARRAFVASDMRGSRLRGPREPSGAVRRDDTGTYAQVVDLEVAPNPHDDAPAGFAAPHAVPGLPPNAVLRGDYAYDPPLAPYPHAEREQTAIVAYDNLMHEPDYVTEMEPGSMLHPIHGASPDDTDDYELKYMHDAGTDTLHTSSMSEFYEDDGSSSGGWVERQQPPDHGHVRKVELQAGNWIVDYLVPSPIANAVEAQYKEQAQPKEFTHMRYSAVTCDPDEFTRENGWGLRTSTDYYNEDRNLLTRTLYHVIQNIRDICKNHRSKFWSKYEEEGRPGWQRIVVALVYDGIDPCDKETLDVLATMGVYQDGIMKRQVDDKETIAHLFEYTTQVAVDTTPKLVLPKDGHDSNMVPVQLIFCLKQKNAKKINSHRWVFNALGQHLHPEICILLDVGTKPGPWSIYYLWEAFYNRANLGGACGEIHVMKKHGIKLLNPLVAAQHFEYKTSNILDKPFESMFGYVSVLPGAFSAYRYKAILGRPLQQYFHGDQTLADRLGRKGLGEMNIFRKNMFLAEDRILCFELVAKAGEKWVLSYVKSSRAETDVPEHTAEFISQRRRWLNGSFAASIYAIVHFYRLYRSKHNFMRMFFFHVQELYNLCQMVLSWFAMGNLWLTFAIIIAYLPNILLRGFSDGVLIAFHWVNVVLMWIYAFFLALQFVLALGNRPKSEHVVYNMSIIVFGFLGLYVLVVSLWLTARSFSNMEPHDGNYTDVIFSNTTAVLIASLAAMFGIYLIASIMYLDPWHMMTSSAQYFFMAPSFVNVINVYAFCNLHDVSWGTKGSDKSDALPAVHSTAAQNDKANNVVEECAYDQDTLDERFQGVVTRALAPYSRDHTKDRPTEEDSNKTFRTRLVALWLLSNAILVAVVMNLYEYTPRKKLDEEMQEGQDNQQIYFKMAFARFVGSCAYWLQWNATRWFRRT